MDITQVVTKKDLVILQDEILKAIKETISQLNTTANKKWLKSNEVQEMLNLSASGLQNLRVAGTIPYTKLSGTIYFDYQDIVKILEQNKRNRA